MAHDLARQRGIERLATTPRLARVAGDRGGLVIAGRLFARGLGLRRQRLGLVEEQILLRRGG